MSDKFIYQNARIKSMESSLFTAQSVGRLLDCTTFEQAYKTLTDIGFGAGASADGGVDALFLAEENRAAEILREFNVDGALDAFLAEYDFLNLKSLFKSRVTGKASVLAPCGAYETDEIKGWIEQDGKSDAPEFFGEAIAEFKKLEANGNPSPRKIDCIADKAQFAYIFSILKKGDKLTKSYFVKKADFMNISAFLRCKKLGFAKSAFAEGFIEGGELGFLPDIYDLPLESLKEKCKRTDYEQIVSQIVDDGNIVAFEVAVDDLLFKIFNDQKDELFGLAPVVNFYLAKKTQIRIAKLIVAGVKNGVDKNEIKERMRELYA